MRNKTNNTGLVYSTDHGSMCPGCARPVDLCTCKQQAPAPKTDGIVRVCRETKGRKGKGVTVVTGLGLDGEDLRKLAKELKARCGSGGTVKDHTIEIQGDHRDLLMDLLKAKGYTVKRAGG